MRESASDLWFEMIPKKVKCFEDLCMPDEYREGSISVEKYAHTLHPWTHCFTQYGSIHTVL